MWWKDLSQLEPTWSQCEPMIVNACYAQAPVGTGTWTRALMEARPDWDFLVPSTTLYTRNKTTFYRKLWYESTFRWRTHGTALHPYAAVAFDSDSYMVVLDTIGDEQGATWHRAAIRAAVGHCRGLASISTSESELVASAYGRDCSLLTPFPDRDYFSSTKSRPQVRARAIKALYWGGPDPRKGIARAATRLSGSSVQLTVVGHEVPDAYRCLPILRDRELVQLIDDSDLVLFPSVREGFGLPVYEALLRNRPLVCRDLPSYRDIVISTEALTFMAHNDTDNLEEICHTVTRAATTTPRDTLRCPDRKDAVGLLRSQLENWTSA